LENQSTCWLEGPTLGLRSSKDGVAGHDASPCDSLNFQQKAEETKAEKKTNQKKHTQFLPLLNAKNLNFFLHLKKTWSLQ